MPTQHVEPQATEHLGHIANALLKARKVVVVTGAGISTNSGIPDFRSENGLYSLIQAQFDATCRKDGPNELSIDGVADKAANALPSAKRRKLLVDDVKNGHGDLIVIQPESSNPKNCIEVESCLPPFPALGDEAGKETVFPVMNTTTATATTTIQTGVEINFSTPLSKCTARSVAEPRTSPLSSPPAEDLLVPPSTFRSCVRHTLTDLCLPLSSSSPLSSPPPILFDPFRPSPPDEPSSGSRSSTSMSEVDEDNNDEPSSQFGSSQGSSGGRNNLPNMKGKDLFDANIWSDPVKTSVFYTFATSLRQKIRNAEPTTSHRFISHLRDNGKLVRCYTQNIDQIEEKVGLSTKLQDGPGSRGRFSRRSTVTTSQVSKILNVTNPALAELQQTPAKPSQSGSPGDSSTQPCKDVAANDKDAAHRADEMGSQTNQMKRIPDTLKKQARRSGVECVFLHGSLDLLRCFLCGHVCSWDEHDRETETLSGQQPECPHCVGATAAREERGKRALGVGKLRPDIVLYGEEHPSSHLISPIVTHDLSLYPDMLLILGTSLRVHGLKVMVREFAKAVHSKSGKVIFVNFTKPSESIWGDIIDYWIQWDCDAWVDDLRTRIPKFWQDQVSPKPKKKRESSRTSENGRKDGENKRPPALNPVALRDTKVTGAYWTLKVLHELHRITGHLGAQAKFTNGASVVGGRRASMSSVAALPASARNFEAKEGKIISRPSTKAIQKLPRKSAPGALEKAHARSSSMQNPNHGRWRIKTNDPTSIQATTNRDVPVTLQTTAAFAHTGVSSILSSVKENPRIRKRKVMGGEDVPPAPSVGIRRSGSSSTKVNKDALKLPPIRTTLTSNYSIPLYGKPCALEPRSPPSGPLSSLSPNLRRSKVSGKTHAFYLQSPLNCLPKEDLPWARVKPCKKNKPPTEHDVIHGTRPTTVVNSPLMAGCTSQVQEQGKLEGRLMNWGSSWSCTR